MVEAVMAMQESLGLSKRRLQLCKQKKQKI